MKSDKIRYKRKEIRSTPEFNQVLKLESTARKKKGYANWSESDIIHMAVAQFIMSSGYVYWELPDKLQKEVQSSFIK